ncbi:MAG: hypothetical protein IPL79_08935 [Myxococcales bacterium]|nr:hypothetical protein [Myxococcales bacterium]
MRAKADVIKPAITTDSYSVSSKRCQPDEADPSTLGAKPAATNSGATSASPKRVTRCWCTTLSRVASRCSGTG